MRNTHLTRVYRSWLSTLDTAQLCGLGGPAKSERKRRTGATPQDVKHNGAPAEFRRLLASWRPEANPERYWWWRGQVLSRAGWACRDCHATRVELQAHHIYGWREFPRHRYDPANGAALCRPCHERIHGRSFDGSRRPLLAPLDAPTVIPAERG